MRTVSHWIGGKPATGESTSTGPVWNPATGEQTNVVSENTIDRPWYQRDYMRAVAGNEDGAWSVCEGVFTCGTALANEQGSEILRTRSIDRAKAERLRAAIAAGVDGVMAAHVAFPAFDPAGEAASRSRAAASLNRATAVTA